MKRIIFIGRSALIVTLIVALATIAVPYDDVFAGGIGPTGQATERTQVKNTANTKISSVKDTITAANSAITAGNTTNLFVKENLLDGIAWSVAKQMVSNMTRSLINWVNSGFQGSPSFVTDFKQMLLDALDTAAGEYIKSLGGIGEFICSPFQLDVQAALSINYAQARSGMPAGGTENQCTLTGIASNIENFLSGATENWGQWFEVTANPQNTPYGAYLAAEASLNIRLRNEAGQEIEVASWGDGFLSKKVCQAVEGTTQENCKITTPGQVVSEALTFQLSTGPQSLVEADEINELIGALLNQLVLKAVEGLNGLLGLSEDTGDGNGSYLDQMVDESTDLVDYTPYKKEMDEALAREVKMLTLINKALKVASSTATSTQSADFKDAIDDATDIVTQVSTNMAQLTRLINRYQSATTTAAARLASNTATSTGTSTTPNAAKLKSLTNQIRQEVVLDYLSLKSSGDLMTEAFIEQKRTEWSQAIYPYGDKKL